MTQRPITLTPDQVRAALDGRLTQVRMPCNPKGKLTDGKYQLRQDPIYRKWVFGPAEASLVQFMQVAHGWADKAIGKCPFGVVGDRLWVRESFMVQPTPGCSMGEMYRGSKLSVYYRDETKRDLNNDASFRFKGGHVHACIFDYNPDMYGRWRGPKMMKEWASRITVELTGVRVEKDGETWCWVLDVKRVGQ